MGNKCCRGDTLHMVPSLRLYRSAGHGHNRRHSCTCESEEGSEGSPALSVLNRACTRSDKRKSRCLFLHSQWTKKRPSFGQHRMKKRSTRDEREGGIPSGVSPTEQFCALWAASRVNWSLTCVTRFAGRGMASDATPTSRKTSRRGLGGGDRGPHSGLLRGCWRRFRAVRVRVAGSVPASHNARAQTARGSGERRGYGTCH